MINEWQTNQSVLDYGSVITLLSGGPHPTERKQSPHSELFCITFLPTLHRELKPEHKEEWRKTKNRRMWTERDGWKESAGESRETMTETRLILAQYWPIIGVYIYIYVLA